MFPRRPDCVRVYGLAAFVAMAVVKLPPDSSSIKLHPCRAQRLDNTDDAVTCKFLFLPGSCANEVLRPLATEINYICLVYTSGWERFARSVRNSSIYILYGAELTERFANIGEHIAGREGRSGGFFEMLLFTCVIVEIFLVFHRCR